MVLQTSPKLYPYQIAALTSLSGKYGACIPDSVAAIDQRQRKAKLASKMRGTKKSIATPASKTPSRQKNGGLVINNAPSLTWTNTTLQQYVNMYAKTMTGRSKSVTTSNTTSTAWVQTTSTGTINQIWTDLETMYVSPVRADRRMIRIGETYSLPDGAKLEVDLHGNYKILDKDAQIVYRANRLREFNKYINASDLLEEFIAYLGSMDVRRKELADLPVSLFVNWLIIRAAEADGEEVPREERLQLESAVSLDKGCLFCGRRIPRQYAEMGSKFCSGAHMDAYPNRFALVEQPSLAIENAALAE